MMRTSLSRLALRSAASLLVVLLAAPAAAYVIMLKDGSRIVAKEKPNVQGKNWVFVIPSGNRQSIPIAEVDMEKTEKVNASGTGDAYDLGDTTTTIQTGSADSRKPSLSEYIKTNKKSEMGQPVVPTPTAAPEGGFASRPIPGEATGAGAIDPVVNDTFTRALEGASIRGARLSPMAQGVRLQAITDTEQQVFAAIGAVARGLKECRSLGKPLERAELTLGTSAGEGAGKFVMTAEDAESLLNGKTSAPKYFVAAVQF